ncbi:hypothetical protein FB451DRAFT_1284414 [Mycena latifolia]|nr:hypothetical protein FB451DRAFT_1316468 [Mycena latifolia]KAJ7451416.1 hypothetical protein FB451DRAFT_1284414 [Mycena latifolia]
MDGNVLRPLHSTKYLLFEPTPCCAQSADPTADRGITGRARGRTSKNSQCLRCPYEVRPSAHACSRYTRRCAGYRTMSTYFTLRKLWGRCLRLRCGPFHMLRVPSALHAMSGTSLPARLHVAACYVLINEIGSTFTSDFSLHFFCAMESVSCLNVLDFHSLC